MVWTYTLFLYTTYVPWTFLVDFFLSSSLVVIAGKPILFACPVTIVAKKKKYVPCSSSSPTW
jgi:hypothetical protein